MSKLDEKYINNLETFTSALGLIVEDLKEQQKARNSDTVNDFLKAPMDNLVDVVADLKKVTLEGFKSLKEDNKVILKKIESIKQQKESGMFDKIEDPKNKNKIVDGIKVVILIAAGVLALGMAFKLIGKIDFLSVIALSATMLAMSMVFNKIGDLKSLTYGSVFKLSIILPMMAAGLALSGYILQSFPQFTLQQGMSIILIGGALGVATSLLLSSVSKIGFTSLAKAAVIPFLLPLIAWGIVKASLILKDVQKISFMQVLSIGLVGIALGVATYGIGLALKGMKGITWKEMLALPIMIPLIATGIVLASEVFQGFIPIKNPMELLKGSAVIGIAVLAMSFSVALLGRTLRGRMTELEIGVLGSIMVAGAIVAVSYAFKVLPTTLNAPDFMWTLKTGLALLTFSSIAILISIAMNAKLSFGGAGGSISGSIGGDIKKLGLGILAIIGIAASIVAVSQIMRLFAEGPIVDPKWALGVGLSILILSAPVMLIGILLSTGIGVPAFALGLLSLPLIALSMVAISEILKLGNWDNNFPSSEWSLGVGGSLLLFSLATIAAAGAGLAGLVGKFFTGGEDPLVRIAKSMVDISFVIQAGKWDGNYPKKDWALGVGTALTLFAAATIVAGGVGLASGIISFFTGDKDPLMTLTQSMVNVSKVIQDGVWDGNYPKLDWALSVGTAMSMFAAVTVVAGGSGLASKIFDFFTGKDPLMVLAQSMVDISKKLQEGSWTGSYPTRDWVMGVAEAFNTISNIDAKANSIRNLADSFRELADSLKNVGSFDNLQKISSGLVLLSVIDDAKLQIVLDKIRDNENTLKNIYGDNNSGMLNLMEKIMHPVQATISPESILSLKSTPEINKEQQETNKKLDNVISLLSQILESSDKPSQAGSFYK